MAPSPSASANSIKVVLSNTGPQGPVGPSNHLFAAQTLTDAPTIAWDTNLGGIGRLTLGGDRLLATPVNLIPGPYALIVTQGAGGGFELDYSDDYEFPTGEIPELSPFPGSISVQVFWSDGATLYLTSSQSNMSIGGGFLITESGDFITDENDQRIIAET